MPGNLLQNFVAMRICGKKVRDGLIEETGGRDYRSESVQEYAETSLEGLKTSVMGGESAYSHRQTLKRDLVLYQLPAGI